MGMRRGGPREFDLVWAEKRVDHDEERDKVEAIRGMSEMNS